MAQHLWITGDRAHARIAAAGAAGLPLLAPPADAHRRIGGPYTLAAQVLEALAPDLLARCPELVREHDIEVLSAAPDLRELVPATRETLTSLAIPSERTRFYPRARTMRLSHGIAELLRGYAATLGERRLLVLDRVEEADPTDVELLTVLLRRIDPELLTIAVGAGGEADPDLAAARDAYCAVITAPAVEAPAPGDARTHVWSDCVDDDPAALAAYESLTGDERAALHDERADELAATGRTSPTRGAVPYHRERGTAPATAGAQALLDALNACVDMGFYAATLDFGQRGRALVPHAANEAVWWTFTTKMTTSLSALGRPREAEALYDEARALSTNPLVHRQAAYATAMLYTRHHETEDKDHRRAKAWINEAIVIAELLGSGGGSGNGFAVVFQQNGLALIEVHLKNLPRALELVTGGLDRLDSELGAAEHQLHRSVLLYNRAQVLAGLGRLEEALADYRTVSAVDPNYPEYHLDLGNLLHRMGREEEALAEYDTAIRVSPPFSEAYYNRAEVRLCTGDLDGALADLDHVLELDPASVDALVNRAGIHTSLGDLDALRADVEAGLALDPGNPQLLCSQGQLYAEDGLAPSAEAAFRAALAADPAQAPAWSGLASLAFDAGDLPGAVEHLDRALAVGDDALLRYNRATVYRALGRDEQALADLDRAAELDPADEDIQRERAELTAAV